MSTAVIDRSTVPKKIVVSILNTDDKIRVHNMSI